jgi:hypothetical protein
VRGASLLPRPTPRQVGPPAAWSHWAAHPAPAPAPPPLHTALGQAFPLLLTHLFHTRNRLGKLVSVSVEAGLGPLSSRTSNPYLDIPLEAWTGTTPYRAYCPPSGPPWAKEAAPGGRDVARPFPHIMACGYCTWCYSTLLLHIDIAHHCTLLHIMSCGQCRLLAELWEVWPTHCVVVVCHLVYHLRTNLTAALGSTQLFWMICSFDFFFCLFILPRLFQMTSHLSLLLATGHVCRTEHCFLRV